MFHKEGAKIILISTTLTVILIFVIEHFIDAEWLEMTLQLIVLFFLLMILQFFRNP